MKTQKKEYLCDQLYILAFLFFAYEATFYIRLRDYTNIHSHLLLIVLIMISTIIDNLCAWRKSSLNVIMTGLIPLGIYASISYDRFFPVQIGWLNCVTLLLVAAIPATVALMCIFTLARKVNKKQLKMVIMRLIYIVEKFVLSVAAVVLLSAILLAGFCGGSIESTSVNTVSPTTLYNAYDIDNTLENNMEVLSKGVLQWEQATIHENLVFLQTIINIEGRYLGFDKPIRLVVSYIENPNPEYYTAAFYDDQESLITLDFDYLLNNDAFTVCKAIIHECRHAAQFAAVRLYDSLNEQQQHTYILSCDEVYNPLTWKEEFMNYQNSGAQSFEAYGAQLCEVDARNYSNQCTYEIFQGIEEYIGSKIVDE